MKNLTIQLPDSLEMDDNEIILMLAVQLYDKGKLTLGQAADLVGLSKEEFMAIPGNYDISIFGETISDIEKDLRNAE